MVRHRAWPAQQALFLVAAAQPPVLLAAVECWGNNHWGQLDVPEDLYALQLSARSWHTCALTVDSTILCWGLDNDGQSTPPMDAGPGRNVAAGGTHSCASSLTGRVSCWGANDDGRASPPAELEAAAQVVAGGWHSCSRGASGTVRCWGDDGSRVPQDVGPCKELAAGSHHSCALTISGKVRCWGSNAYGQLDVPSGLPAVEQLVAGVDHSCARTTGAPGVICWGWDAHGQSSPPADLGGVTMLAAGAWHTCAVTAASTVRCWGDNRYGQAVVPGHLQGVEAVAAGQGHTCVVVHNTSATSTTSSISIEAGPTREHSAREEELEELLHRYQQGLVAMLCVSGVATVLAALFGLLWARARRHARSGKQMAELASEAQCRRVRLPPAPAPDGDMPSLFACVLRQRAAGLGIDVDASPPPPLVAEVAALRPSPVLKAVGAAGGGSEGMEEISVPEGCFILRTVRKCPELDMSLRRCIEVVTASVCQKLRENLECHPVLNPRIAVLQPEDRALVDLCWAYFRDHIARSPEEELRYSAHEVGHGELLRADEE